MKKSELKSLLKIITEEVIAAKRKQLSESKGMSGMKKSPESTDHTEKIADSKDLTGSAPKEKTEGKKLPVVKKPANPKVGSIKEEILQMIREEIDEMARTAGAVAPQYRKEIEPGKWVIMGHPNQEKYPDGTPTTEPKGPYIKKGRNTDIGGPRITPPVGNMRNRAAISRTEEAVADILKFKPDATPEEIGEELAKKNSDDAPLSLDPNVIADAMAKVQEPEMADADSSKEPDMTDLENKEREERKKTIEKLRNYLLRKRGLKK